jgi:hypothetical protein
MMIYLFIFVKTLNGNNLIKLARGFRKKLNYKFDWTSNGNIFLRQYESSKIISVGNGKIFIKLRDIL